MIVPFTETEKECLFPKKCPHFRCWAHFGAEVHWCDIQGKSERIMQPADDTECVATVKYQFEEEEHIGEQYELDLGKLGKFVLRKGGRMEYEAMMSKKGDRTMKRAEECQHRGTMTLTPTETRGWEIMDWCFYLKKIIKEKCPSDCPYKDKEVYYE